MNNYTKQITEQISYWDFDQIDDLSSQELSFEELFRDSDLEEGQEDLLSDFFAEWSYWNN